MENSECSLTISRERKYNSTAQFTKYEMSARIFPAGGSRNVEIGRSIRMIQFLQISLIVTSIALIASVILQSKGAGLGGLTGSDTGGVFTARRGIEKTLFWVTIALSVAFFVLTITLIIITR
jgi:preprotein translocase subunit SecG